MSRHHQKPKIRCGPHKRTDIEERITRLQPLVEQEIDTGRYPLSFLTGGRQQSDADEYGTRYTAGRSGVGRVLSRVHDAPASRFNQE